MRFSLNHLSNSNNVDEDDLDAEQECELAQLFQQSMVEDRIASLIAKSRLTTRCDSCPRAYSDAPLVIALLVYKPNDPKLFVAERTKRLVSAVQRRPWPPHFKGPARRHGWELCGHYK